jgi:hypothetical protein
MDSVRIPAREQETIDRIFEPPAVASLPWFDVGGLVATRLVRGVAVAGRGRFGV